MATLAADSPLNGARGRIGDFIFRRVEETTVVSAAPSDSLRDQSPDQRATRERFQEATHYAHNVVRDPRKRAYYARKAKKNKLPNAYTAAITDYMRKTIVESVNIEQYSGKRGGSVVIAAEKEGFTLAKVFVTVLTKDGQEVERGKAVQHAGKWLYRNKVQTGGTDGLCFVVETIDGMGRRTAVEQVWAERLRHLPPE